MFSDLISLYRNSPILQWMPLRHMAKTAFKLPLRGLELVFGLSTCAGDPLDYRFAMVIGIDEPETTAVLKRLTWNPNGVLLDVGAHVGEFSRLLSKLAPQSAIYSFEPNPVTFKVLARNASRWPSCQIFNLALGAKDDTVALSLEPGLSTTSAIVREPSTSGAISRSSGLTYSVLTVKGSDFLASRAVFSVDFVKVDVEGYECEVLVGLSPLIWNSDRLIVVVELNPACLLRSGSSAADLFALLWRLDFTVFECGKVSAPEEITCDADVERLVHRMGAAGYTNLLGFKGYGGDEVMAAISG